jgi:hypothetical protein
VNLSSKTRGFWRVRSAQLDQPGGAGGVNVPRSRGAVAMSALGERRHKRGSWSGRF